MRFSPFLICGFCQWFGWKAQQSTQVNNMSYRCHIFDPCDGFFIVPCLFLIFLSCLVDWSVWFCFCLLFSALFHSVVVVLLCHMVYFLIVTFAWWKQSHNCWCFLRVNYWGLCLGVIGVLVALWWWVRFVRKILFLLWMVEGCIIMVEISCFQSVGGALFCIFFDCSHIICFYEV